MYVNALLRGINFIAFPKSEKIFSIHRKKASITKNTAAALYLRALIRLPFNNE